MSSQPPDPSDLAELLARLDELRGEERRAVSARMVSVAGHLIGTPLNVIAGRAALIRSNPSPEAIEENVRRIEEQVERLAQRIRRLIEHFGFPEPASKPRPVSEVLGECVRLYRPVAERRGVLLDVSVDGVDALLVEGSLASLVLTTLLSLAMRTTPVGQRVVLAASEDGPGRVSFDLVLPGLEPLSKNFERFEPPPERGARHDAGALEALWVCLGLARRSGGQLEVSGAPQGGSQVRFRANTV